MKLVLAILLIASNANADCALMGLSAKPVTAPNTVLPDGGGIVIAALPDRDGSLAKGDVAQKHPFSIKGINQLLQRSLAPGLIVIPTPSKAGDLLDPKGTSVLAFKTTTTKIAVPPAPKVKAVVFEARRGRKGVENVVVMFDTLPAGTLAVILGNDKGVAKSFGIVGAKTNDIHVYDAGNCLVLPNGTLPTRQGDKVTVRIVDALGRESAPTAPLIVEQGL